MSHITKMGFLVGAVVLSVALAGCQPKAAVQENTDVNADQTMTLPTTSSAPQANDKATIGAQVDTTIQDLDKESTQTDLNTLSGSDLQ